MPSTPVPSTPAPTETPAAAVDVAAAFRAMVEDPAFSARVAISAGSSIGGAETSTTGTLDVSGADRRQRLTTRSGGAPTNHDAVVSAGRRYVLAHGMWLESGAEADIVDALRAATSVTERGTTVVNGETLHDLSISPVTDLPIAVPAGGGVQDLATGLSALVRADGTPVTVRVNSTWRQRMGKRTVDAARSAEFGFEDVGSAVAVEVPDDLWAFHTSKRYAYRMGHPVDWLVRPGSGKFADAYLGFGGQAVYASRATSRGLSLATLSSALTRYLPRISGVRKFVIDRNRPARLGPLRARRIEFHYTYKGQRYWAIGYLAVKGGTYYWVALETTKPTSRADRDLGARFASLFSPR